jgi:tetratricopeptide (TPR) repeat protein
VEEAPKKSAVEVKAATDDAAKKNLKELETKAREEADKRARVELEKRAREEANKRADEEIKRLADEKAKKAKAQEAPAIPAAVAPVVAKPLPAIGGLDDMVAVAEADLLQSQGKSEEAAKLYRQILSANPDNQAVKKKLEALDETMRSKMPPATKAPVLKVVETAPVAPAPAGENDSNIKKKSNKIGYV